jgi:Family of unknown function (DUF5333)
VKRGFLILAFGLTACGGSNVPDMPSYLMTARLDTGLASVIADGCTSVRYNDAYGTALMKTVSEQFVTDGRTVDELNAWIASEEHDEWVTSSSQAYFQRNGVDPNAPVGSVEDDMCRIADQEIASGSGIGKLLEKV